LFASRLYRQHEESLTGGRKARLRHRLGRVDMNDMRGPVASVPIRVQYRHDSEELCVPAYGEVLTVLTRLVTAFPTGLTTRVGRARNRTEHSIQLAWRVSDKDTHAYMHSL
jgi:hypothetical protein